MDNEEQTAMSLAAQAPSQVPSVASDGPALLAVIARAASDPQVDVSKMEKLFDLQERISARLAEQDFNSAMTEAQSEMRPVAADCNNPQTKSKYASYYALDKALRPIYTKHGFAPSYDTDASPKPDHIRVLCYLSHRNGHCRTYKIDMPADGKGAKGGDVMTKTHATGAGYSYGQRYLLKGMFNISIGDDDDNGADGDSQSLTDDELQAIFDLLERSKADRARFCKYFGVSDVPDIKRKDYRRAIEALNLKLTEGSKK